MIDSSINVDELNADSDPTMHADIINDETSDLPIRPTSTTPYIWGYVRMSTREQEHSPAVQAELIKRFSEGLDGHFVGCRCDPAVSGSKVDFEKRREAKKLMNAMQAGDSLVVWKIDRLGRSVMDLHRILEKFLRMKVNVYILNFGGNRLDFTTAMGRAMVGFFAVLAEMESNLIGERVKEAFAWRKKHDIPCYPKMGYKRVRAEPREGQRKGDLHYKRHQEECDAMKEIYERHSKGETITSIYIDFMKRGVKTRKGKPWAKLPTSANNPYPNIHRFYLAYRRYYNEYVLKGKEL